MPPHIFLIADAAETESPVCMCCLVLWDAPPGFILKGGEQKSLFQIHGIHGVPDSGSMKDSWVVKVKCDPLEISSY